VTPYAKISVLSASRIPAPAFLRARRIGTATTCRAATVPLSFTPAAASSHTTGEAAAKGTRAGVRCPCHDERPRDARPDRRGQAVRPHPLRPDDARIDWHGIPRTPRADRRLNRMGPCGRSARGSRWQTPYFASSSCGSKASKASGTRPSSSATLRAPRFGTLECRRTGFEQTRARRVDALISRSVAPVGLCLCSCDGCRTMDNPSDNPTRGPARVQYRPEEEGYRTRGTCATNRATLHGLSRARDRHRRQALRVPREGAASPRGGAGRGR